MPPPRGSPYLHLPYDGGPLTIHPLLAFYPSVAPVNYNLSHPVEHSLRPNVFASLSYRSASHFKSRLYEPATSPRLPTLTLSHPHLPWQPHIRSSKPASCIYVTVRDVLEALHAFLQCPVTLAEYKMLPSQADRNEVAVAFHARCERTQDRERTTKKGVIRLDFLRGRDVFMGLSCTRYGHDVWMLNVE
ncbi:hypothetical protein SCLCIDRAFT_1209190 [Scleroderma citrinum Foug A]|uniref:DUF6699 domain-containing protein n=1 Tax=Scleroderma citrinum Foug A TaxID=1036808 RepID=A0A0C3A3X7_9AGAM|nr:hypothetical protein SCLCIDRAFT_1209190 [Scleroderma citrinum Foug A]